MEEICNQLFLPLRVGYEINISSIVGIGLDVGAMFLLIDEEGHDTPVLPSFGINLFYRIKQN